MLSGTFEEWLDREWLLANGRGGFASSTLIGCPTRREHGWMTWNVPGPRVERWVLWAHAAENLHVDGRTNLLANFEFNNAVDPHGYRHLTSVEIVHDDPAPHVAWHYKTDTATVRRSLSVVDGQDLILVRYHVKARDGAEIRMLVWPLIAARPLNALRRRSAGEMFQMSQDAGAIGMAYRLDPRIGLSIIGRRTDGGPPVEFQARGDWWYNFRYRREAERGLEFGEDLMVPGTFLVTGRSTLDFELVGVAGISDLREAWRRVRALSLPPEGAPRSSGSVAVRFDASDGAPGGTLRHTTTPADVPEVLLRRAARQFVFRNAGENEPGRIGLIAGFPWLGEYCRDACIALPGLLLATGRHDEARELLLRMALLRRDGALPSHLSDDPQPHEYVTADGALWFIYAVDAFLTATGETGSAAVELLKACDDLLQGLVCDQRKGVHLEDDGLLVCEDPAAAATWMDARYAWVFQTPRVGKAVEMNALWYHALSLLAERLEAIEPDHAAECRQMAHRVRASFAPLFWNASIGGLHDVVGERGPDASIRPNQIFAVSFRHSPLGDAQQASVVRLVRDRLLTPQGLRTLDGQSPQYLGHYAGPIESREKAAHQGSVYAWLLGPFVDAYLRIHAHSARAREECRGFLEPLIAHLTGSAGVLGVSELFDGDAPHAPRGGISQAWSVGELFRAWQLVTGSADAARRAGAAVRVP